MADASNAPCADIALDEVWNVFFRADRTVTLAAAAACEAAGRREGNVVAELTGRILTVVCGIRSHPEAIVARQLDELAAEADRRGEPRMRWLASDGQAALNVVRGHLDRALAIGRATTNLPAAERSDAESAFGLYNMALASLWSGRIDDALQYGYRLLQVARALGHDATLATALNFVGNVQSEHCCDHEDALPLLREAHALARTWPQGAGAANMTVGLAEVLLNTGHADEGAQLLDDMLTRPGMPGAVNRRRGTMARVYVAAGRLADAEPWLNEFTPDQPGEPLQVWTWQLAQVELLCARGRFETARELAQAELARPTDAVRPPMQLARMHDALRHACAELGDSAGAGQAARDAHQAFLPMVRAAARASYLSMDLERDPHAIPAATDKDLRRLNAIDETTRLVAKGTGRRVPAFLAHVSHELRTPINGVLGLSSLLLMSTLDDQQRRYADALQQSARTLLQLVNDVLDLARLERGRFVLAPQPMALSPWLAETFAPFEALGTHKGLAMQLVPSGQLPHGVMADPLRLRQVVSNLLSNAVKFTAAGSVSLHVDWRASHDGAGLLRLQVRDTGKGIAPQVQVRLFQEFEQSDEDARDAKGGTGLGLALCRELVLRMSGRIGMHSSPGAGSTFWCELPLQLAETGDVRPDAVILA